MRVTSNTKAIVKLKKKYSKWPWETNLNGFKNWLLQIIPAFMLLWLLRKILIKSEYRLKRESIKFFELCNRAYAANKIRITDRFLVVALELVGLDFSNDYVVLLRNAVASTITDPKSRREQAECVLLATRELEVLFFDATGWYQLSRGLFCLGYFRAAWVARENSLDLSIAEGLTSSSSSTASGRAIEAYLERLEFDSVRKLLAENLVLEKKASDTFRESLRWFEGNVSVISAEDTCSDGGSVQIFHELVYGKKVVLVGPCSAYGEHGDEIDSADTVARIKYPGRDYLLDERFFGKRCDISQYPSLESLREIAKISSHEYFDDLQLIVTGEADSRAVRNTPVYSENQESPIYRTTVTTGLRLLISLVRQRPSTLKIFGYSFYLEIEPYNTGMRSFYENSAWKFGQGHFLFGKSIDYPKVEITSSFGAHDPVSNFCFAQNLYKAGLFDIEPYGKSILELTPYQYVERLEEMLGDW